MAGGDASKKGQSPLVYVLVGCGCMLPFVLVIISLAAYFLMPSYPSPDFYEEASREFGEPPP